EKDGSEGIDVPDRIEGDASEPPSRVVAQQMRDEAVRCLMKGDSDDHRDDPDGRKVDRLGAHDARLHAVGYGQCVSRIERSEIRDFVLRRASAPGATNIAVAARAPNAADRRPAATCSAFTFACCPRPLWRQIGPEMPSAPAIWPVKSRTGTATQRTSRLN